MVDAEDGTGSPVGEAGTVYHWPWYHHAFTFLPWVLLLLLFTLPRNRTIGAGAILVPVLLVYLPWPLLTLLGENATGPIEPLCLGPALALATVGLLSPWLGTMTGRRRYTRSLLVGLATTAITMVSFSAGSREFPVVFAAGLVMTAEIITVVAIVRATGGSTGSGAHFFAWFVGTFLGLGTVVGALLFFVGFAFHSLGSGDSDIIAGMMIGSAFARAEEAP